MYCILSCPNKHFTCFTAFHLCRDSLLQSWRVRALSLTTGLMARIRFSPRRDLASVSSQRTKKLCFKPLKDKATQDHFLGIFSLNPHNHLQSKYELATIYRVNRILTEVKFFAPVTCIISRRTGFWTEVWLISEHLTLSLPTKVHLVKAVIFPVVMYGCESWTVKKAERRRIDAFEVWCWGRLLRVPWTARRSNQSILKEISPGCSLEGLMLKLKLQYFGHLMWRTYLFEKTLILRKIEDRTGRGRQRMR